MDRRAFLAASGASILGLAGCSSGDTGGTTRSPQTKSATVTGTTSGNTDSSGEPTVKPTTTQPDQSAKKVLAFGEWYTADDFAYRVDSVEKRTEFHDPINDRTVHPPEGSVVLICHMTAKVIARDCSYLKAYQFGFVIDGSAVKVQPGMPIKEGDGMPFSTLQIEGKELTTYDVDCFESGSKNHIFFGATVNEGSVSDTLPRAGFNADVKGGYEIQWKKK